MTTSELIAKITKDGPIRPREGSMTQYEPYYVVTESEMKALLEAQPEPSSRPDAGTVSPSPLPQSQGTEGEAKLAQAEKDAQSQARNDARWKRIVELFGDETFGIFTEGREVTIYLDGKVLARETGIESAIDAAMASKGEG